MGVRLLALAACALLAGCGTYTTPAAVRMADGRVLTGTTTASLSAGTFQVAEAKTGIACRGNYDPLNTAPTISAPVSCSDGRTGAIVVTRTPDGLSGSGTVTLTDGSSGAVAFGNLSTTVLTPPPAEPQVAAAPQFDPVPSAEALAALEPGKPAPEQTAYADPSTAATGSSAYSGYSSGSRGSSGCTSGNYYGAISCISGQPKTTYVRGYTRKDGTYVRGHYRSRGRR